jgi:hypothetical protein
MDTPTEFKKTQTGSDIGIMNLAKTFSGLSSTSAPAKKTSAAAELKMTRTESAE